MGRWRQPDFSKLYTRAVLAHPALVLLLAAALAAAAACYAPRFRLDASAESLLLKNDRDLRYYREIRARYGSDDFLIVTYAPRTDLFAAETLEDLKALRDALAELDFVAEVISILDVPLLNSPKPSLSELRQGAATLSSPRTDRELASVELRESPLYRNRLLSADGTVTALRVDFRRDERFLDLLARRNALRERRHDAGGLNAEDRRELRRVSREFDRYSAALQDDRQRQIARVRTILDGHRRGAEIHLGGVPMIAADIIRFIRHDLFVFGGALFAALSGLLGAVFCRLRWVVLPMTCCGVSILLMLGLAGLVGWRVTVVSANFVALMLILAISLNVHLIVRYQELQRAAPEASQRTLVLRTLQSKIAPSCYTALTTMIAFGSLLLSGIQPVIDFGWMMVIGIGVAFLVTFTVLPAGLMLLGAGQAPGEDRLSRALLRLPTGVVARHGKGAFGVFAALGLLAAIGVPKLGIDNRFMDYFKASTEIHQGLEVIDDKLGGTMPLDVILDPPADFEASAPRADLADSGAQNGAPDFGGQAGITATSYWFNTFRLQTVARAHAFLEQRPGVGKVLSAATAMQILRQFNDGRPLDDFALSVIYERLPGSVRQALFEPYMSTDGNQMRLQARLYESRIGEERDLLLQDIRRHLETELQLGANQIHLTGMLVLYNNVLQSLFRSQILTLGTVFLIVTVMFAIAFRSVFVAVLAVVPNLFAAAVVLGAMGWLDVPLDIMTITIAAIAIGIAVDDTIHYVHRFRIELETDDDYLAATARCHRSIGRALFYTTVTLVLGFSILVFSNFVPTIHFGLLTGLALSAALIADLTLLPLLFKMAAPWRR